AWYEGGFKPIVVQRSIDKRDILDVNHLSRGNLGHSRDERKSCACSEGRIVRHRKGGTGLRLQFYRRRNLRADRRRGQGLRCPETDFPHGSRDHPLAPRYRGGV